MSTLKNTKYEHVFLLRETLSSVQVEEITKRFTDLVAKHKGTVVATENWGLRNLAYKIKKNKKAHYIMLHLDISYDCLKEIQRLMGVNENILRFLTLKIEDKFDEIPSLVARQSRYSEAKAEEISNPIADATV
jgi:small subunit ribosomal protein S6